MDKIRVLEAALAVPVDEYESFKEANKAFKEAQERFNLVVREIQAHRDNLALALASEKGRMYGKQ